MSRFGIASAGVVAVRRRPSHAAEQVTQLVLGETFRVVRRSRDGEWLAVRADADGYEGWVRSWHVHEVDAARHARWTRSARLRVTRLAATVRSAPEARSEPLVRAPWGSALCGSGPRKGWERVLLPDGTAGYLRAAEVTRRDPPGGVPTLAGLERTARSLLGTPYEWGGRSAWGMDCSGFVQAVLRWHGVGVPRDAWRQAIAFGARPWRPRGPASRWKVPAGSLVFFGTPRKRISHVGLVGRRGDLLHALGRVRSDHPAKATQRTILQLFSRVRAVAPWDRPLDPRKAGKLHTP